MSLKRYDIKQSKQGVRAEIWSDEGTASVVFYNAKTQERIGSWTETGKGALDRISGQFENQSSKPRGK